MADIPAGAIGDGPSAIRQRRAEAIRQLFKSSNVKETNVAVSIGGYSVIVKKDQRPDDARETAPGDHSFRAEQYFP